MKTRKEIRFPGSSIKEDGNKITVTKPLYVNGKQLVDAESFMSLGNFVDRSYLQLDFLRQYTATPIVKTITFNGMESRNPILSTLFTLTERGMMENGEASLKIELKLEDNSSHYTCQGSGSIGPMELSRLRDEDWFDFAVPGVFSGPEGYVSGLCSLMVFGISGNGRWEMSNLEFKGNNMFFSDFDLVQGNLTGSITFTLTPCSFLAGKSWFDVVSLIDQDVEYLPLGITKSAWIMDRPYLFELVSKNWNGKKTVWMSKEIIPNITHLPSLQPSSEPFSPLCVFENSLTDFSCTLLDQLQTNKTLIPITLTGSTNFETFFFLPTTKMLGFDYRPSSGGLTTFGSVFDKFRSPLTSEPTGVIHGEDLGFGGSFWLWDQLSNGKGLQYSEGEIIEKDPGFETGLVVCFALGDE